jgi:hypothetical protein
MFIKDDFCDYCKYRQNDGIFECKEFIYSNGVCIAFEWRTQKMSEDYKEQVLKSRAETIYMNRGMGAEEIDKMDRKRLLSVLSAEHYIYFDKRREEDREQVIEVKRQKELGFTCSEDYYNSINKKPAVKKEEKPKKEEPTIPIHYFYVQTKEGITKVFKKRTDSGGYKSDVVQMRKYIEKNNLILIREEIK